MLFSERIGKRQVRTLLQIESIDHDLEVALWNVTLKHFFNKIEHQRRPNRHFTLRDEVCEVLWTRFFKNRIDYFSCYESTMDYISEWYFKSKWYEKYDFLEKLISMSDYLRLEFADECNEVLKRELSGYRILKGNIVQVTSNEEISSIEEAIDSSDEYKSVNQHLQAALNLLADRIAPDFRNSIKESISAVEAFCKIITKDDKATLGKALAVIERNHSLHGSLKSALNALYGYTSDAGGIRHAMLEEDVKIGFEDAKFMLVTCSAFINYLKAKAG